MSDKERKSSAALSFRQGTWKGLENLPVLFWIVLGVLPVFLAYYIRPMFFSERLAMNYPVDYIMQINPIGHDFRVLLDSVEAWLVHGQTTDHVFTPLVIFLFAPLHRIGYPSAYYLIVIVTLLSYLALGLLAGLTAKSRHHPAIVFLVTLSFFSYGLQFELERGQTHTLALMIGFLAVYLFHKQPRLRWLAYILFCVSVQLKFYPALFVVLFIDNWRNWKANLLRFGALGLANFLLLFLLGIPYFSAFANHMGSSLQGSEIWMGNHSIKAFAAELPKMGIAKLGEGAVDWAASHAALIANILYGYFLLCLAAILFRAWRKNPAGIHTDLLLACVIGALTLPSVNHDYTLPLLTAPFALAVTAWHERDYPWPAIVTSLVIVFASSTYALTVLPAIAKPAYFDNALPPLFVILTIATLLNLAQKGPPPQLDEGRITS